MTWMEGRGGGDVLGGGVAEMTYTPPAVRSVCLTTMTRGWTQLAEEASDSDEAHMPARGTVRRICPTMSRDSTGGPDPVECLCACVRDGYAALCPTDRVCPTNLWMRLTRERGQLRRPFELRSARRRRAHLSV